MRDIILKKLDEIEKSENVKILYCIESGSRAWGFASPDSDYDVRFIYVRPKEFYLRLDKTRDTIEWQLDETLDINGWDIKKVLTLLHKSNPTVYEWKNSKIVYKTTEEWQSIAKVIDSFFLPKAGIYHYLNSAKRTYHEQLEKEKIKLKKYFYVLRPLLACRWILDKGTPPPMPFCDLVDEYLDSEMRPTVEKLLNLKINSPEIENCERIEPLHGYLINGITEIENKLSEMESEFIPNWDSLNDIFLSVI